VALTISLIPVEPTTEPTELDELLQPCSMAQMESDAWLIKTLRERTTQLDLQHLELILFLAEGLGAKVREARRATQGAYGTILPLPPQIWTPVTAVFLKTNQNIGLYLSVTTEQRLAIEFWTIFRRKSRSSIPPILS